jgi:hypothetical protein
MNHASGAVAPDLDLERFTAGAWSMPGRDRDEATETVLL